MKPFAALLAAATLASAQERLPEPSPAPAEKPQPQEIQPLTPKDAADTLSEAEVKDLLDLLRANYLQPAHLDATAVARATAQGLLERLGNGARVLPSVAPAAQTAGLFRQELIPGQAVYLRLGGLSEATLASLDGALERFAANPPPAVILDLRATPPHSDFEVAAEVCRRFVPKGRILFSIKRPRANDEEILTSRSDPAWRGTMVVLVDANTAGAAEVIGAVLRTHLGAYVIGQPTKGEAAHFLDVPLGSGKILRVAVGEVTLPDNSPVFPGGLRPDLVVDVPQEKTDEVLAAGRDGVAALVVETERARMNEHALVSGTNPELDAVQEQQKQKAKGEVPALKLRDVALQRALDYLTSIRIFAAQKR